MFNIHLSNVQIVQSRCPRQKDRRCLRCVPDPGAAGCREDMAGVQQQGCCHRDPKAKAHNGDHKRDLQNHYQLIHGYTRFTKLYQVTMDQEISTNFNISKV